MKIIVLTSLYTNTFHFAVCINPYNDTILDLKKKIERETGVMCEHQNILYNSLMLYDYLLISVCGIKEDHVIHMEAIYQSTGVFRIFLKSTDEITTKVIVESFTTIYQLKQIVQKMEGTFTDDQRLIYNGDILEESRTLGEYNIFKETEIELVHAYRYRPVTVL